MLLIFFLIACFPCARVSWSETKLQQVRTEGENHCSEQIVEAACRAIIAPSFDDPVRGFERPEVTSSRLVTPDDISAAFFASSEVTSTLFKELQVMSPGKRVQDGISCIDLCDALQRHVETYEERIIPSSPFMACDDKDCEKQIPETPASLRPLCEPAL